MNFGMLRGCICRIFLEGGEGTTCLDLIIYITCDFSNAFVLVFLKNNSNNSLFPIRYDSNVKKDSLFSA